MTGFVNVGQLLLREERRRVASVLTQIATQDIDEAVRDILQSNFSAIMISNKTHNRAVSEGYYMLELSHRGLQLLEQKSTQRLLYRFSFSDQKMTMNERDVDGSFLHPFLLKVDQIATHLTLGQASGYSKPKEII